MHSVFIVDDHDIVRFGLETLVAASPGLRVAGSASTLADGMAGIARGKPDLVITDMGLDDSKGLDTVRSIVQAQEGRAVLVVSMHDEMLYGEQVLAMGASGYLMKESAYALVTRAAQAVLRGERWVSPRLNARLIERIVHRGRTEPARPASGAQQPQPISVRELQVLELLRFGKTTKQIAWQLDLSSRTVDVHRANIKRKLGLRTGAELIAFASTQT